MKRPWFKFYGRDYRDGVRDLPWEVTGIYSVFLTLLYEEEGGRIKDHDQRLSRMVGCDIRLWKRARAMMLDAGKLTLTEDGFLSNPRCAAEVRSAELIEQVREKSPIAKPQLTVIKSRKSRKSHDPPPQNDLLAGAIESEPESETPSLRSGVPRRCRIEADLAMSEKSRAFAAERGFLNGRSDALWERFTAHHASKGTQFANVEAGWRTWVLNEIKFQGERNVEPTRATVSGRPRGAVEAILSDIGRQPRE